MTGLAADLAHADSFRFERLAADGQTRQEWHHFIVHGDDARIIINLSIADRAEQAGAVGRLVVLVHNERNWAGGCEEFDLGGVDLGSDGLHARFGECIVEFNDGGYDLGLRLRDLSVHGRLRLVPQSVPHLKANQPLGSGRFSWLYVPRLRADGHLWVNDVRYSMRNAVAYHDHNWGRFGWNDDFGWQWGSAVGDSAVETWSLIFWRMTDRGHLVTRGQGLALFRGDGEVAMFRDTELEIEASGLLRSRARVTIPPAASIIHSGLATDLPSRVDIRGNGGGESLNVAVDLREYGRVVVPSSASGSDSVLYEASGSLEVSGRVAGRSMDLEGTGVFEFLH